MLLTLLFGIVYIVVMGRCSADVSKRLTRRIIIAYSLNLTFCLLIGVAVTAAMLTLTSDVYIFDIIDGIPTISPSEIGYVFFTVLSIINYIYIFAAMFSAFSSIRIGFWAVPLVFINLIGCTFLSQLVVLLSSLTAMGIVEGYVSGLVATITLKAIAVTVFCIVAFLVIRRRNVSTA